MDLKAEDFQSIIHWVVMFLQNVTCYMLDLCTLANILVTNQAQEPLLVSYLEADVL